MLQLELFPQTEEDQMRHQLKKVSDSSEKVRKAMFARHGELAKKFMELHERMYVIEMFICRGKK